LTYISEKIPMLSNIFEMAVTIPIAVITLALHPHVCFAAVSMSAVSFYCDTQKLLVIPIKKKFFFYF
jgi:hypothetical protein